MNEFEKKLDEIYALVGNDENVILDEYNEMDEENPIFTNKWNNLGSLVDKMDKQKFFESLTMGLYKPNDKYITIGKNGYLYSAVSLWDLIPIDDILNYMKVKYCDYSVVILKEYVVTEVYQCKTKNEARYKLQEIIAEWGKTKAFKGNLELGDFVEGNREGAWYDNTQEWGSATIVPTTK